MKPAPARAVYNRIGRIQDWQFYEDRAVAWLLADSALQTAHAVFEFGCGTGRLAVRMMELLPDDAVDAIGVGGQGHRPIDERQTCARSPHAASRLVANATITGLTSTPR
jgi:precorrin-6B methylase 2